jgi:hypothetical protein
MAARFLDNIIGQFLFFATRPSHHAGHLILLPEVTGDGTKPSDWPSS